MRRMGMHIRGILRAVLVCGMSVQILLGLAWLIKNMGGLQTFQESRWLLVGEGMAGKIYSGVLYRGLAALLSSHLWILYVLQLAAAVAAAYGLMSCFVEKDQKALRVLGALALTSIPQAMQCHLAVLPWSLGTSLLLTETALWRKLCGERREQNRGSAKTAVVMLLGWLLLLLIVPVYAWFSMPLLAAILWRTGKREGAKGRLLCVLAGLAVVLCCVTVNCGWNPAAWNRELAANFLSRTGWPYFQNDYDVIPQPLHDEIGLDTARKVSYYADGVEVSLIPKLEEQYGPEETTSLLWELAGICLKRNLRVDVKNVIWDMAAYHATPPILAMQLRGRAYDSHSGVNYEYMKNRDPLLTRYYVTFGSKWWWVMLGLTAVLMVCSMAEQGLSGKSSIWARGREFLRRWFPALAGLEWMILCFVAEGSGIMDYKKTLWVTILWYTAVLSQLAGNMRNSKAEL